MVELPRVPTSVVLEGLMHEAPAGTVSLGWLVARLGPRSFGLVLLLLGLLALLPGIAIAAGLLLAVPASQMLRGHAAPGFPRLVGALMLLLGMLLLATPVPLSNVPYAIAIILLAVAYLEEDGAALCIALGVAIVAFAAGVAALWPALA
jgi:hypothetical protein